MSDEYSRYPDFYRPAPEESYEEQYARWESSEKEKEQNAHRNGYWDTRKECNEIELAKHRGNDGKTYVTKELVDKYGWDRLSVQGVDVPKTSGNSNSTDMDAVATYVRGQIGNNARTDMHGARTEEQIKEWLLNDVGVTVPQMNQIISRAKSGR